MQTPIGNERLYLLKRAYGLVACLPQGVSLVCGRSLSQRDASKFLVCVVAAQNWARRKRE